MSTKAAMQRPAPHLKGQLKKLEGQAEHLLDGVIWLKERYAVLRPMLEQAVIKSHGAGKKRFAFITIQKVLFFSCVLDVAKLCKDADDRTPSMQKIMNTITDNQPLLQELRRRCSQWVTNRTAEELADPHLMHSIKALEDRNVAERAAEFDQRYKKLLVQWQALLNSKTLEAFTTIRDKVLAHTQLFHADGKYTLLDIGEMGLKWTDLGPMIDEVQQVTELIEHVVRAASFTWDDMEKECYRDALDFWSSSGQA